jgi:hypothetical protein
MKYSFIGILIFISFCIMGYGCQKTLNHPSDSVLGNSIEVGQRLAGDTCFINLLKELHGYNMFLLNSIDSGDFSKSDLDKQINYLQEANLSAPEQYEYLSGVFGNTFASRLKAHIEYSRESLAALKVKYGEFQYQALLSAVNSVLSSRNFGLNRGGSLYSFFDERACGFRYFLCMGAVYAGAIVCHSACASTAIAVPVCVAACATMQIHYSLECRDNYCQPINSN